MSRPTHAEFAMQLSYMASHISSWAGSCLTLPEDNHKPVNEYAAQRFLQEMYGRLEHLGNWCNEPAATPSHDNQRKEAE